MRKFLPKIFSPAIQIYCDSVPTGQIQPQKPFFMTRETPRIATNMMKPDGCTGSTMPVRRKYLKAMSPPMGRKASTDGGLWTKGWPAASKCWTNWIKPVADKQGEQKKAACTEYRRMRRYGLSAFMDQ